MRKTFQKKIKLNRIKVHSMYVKENCKKITVFIKKKQYTEVIYHIM